MDTKKPAKSKKRAYSRAISVSNKESKHCSMRTSIEAPSNGVSRKDGKIKQRLFSMIVRKKVEELGQCTADQVATDILKEELEEEFSADGSLVVYKLTPDEVEKKKSGVKRRVYDILNVLNAMDVITKEKKVFTWKGLPCNSDHADFDKVLKDRQTKLEQVEEKRIFLKELLIQHVSYQNLVSRNSKVNTSNEYNAEHRDLLTRDEKISSENDDDKISLPFVVVNTPSRTKIQCEVTPDRMDVIFELDERFEMNDDRGVLKILGLDKSTRPQLKAMLDSDLLDYCDKYNLLDCITRVGSQPNTQPAIPIPLSYSDGLSSDDRQLTSQEEGSYFFPQPPQTHSGNYSTEEPEAIFNDSYHQSLNHKVEASTGLVDIATQSHLPNQYQQHIQSNQPNDDNELYQYKSYAGP